ncbi:MAG: ATP-binding protein [Candidatus Gastranaerophilales bacterium]|nr:ATP-binding protein [Candidatus Gastranaerophilales bacterium]
MGHSQTDDPDLAAASLEQPDEEMVRAARQLLSFLDKMPGGFFIYRAEGNEELLYANDAMLRIFNCDTMEEFRELTGNSFRGIVHPDDLNEVEESIWKQITESQYDLDYVEYRIIPKGGGIRWIDDYGHFVRSQTIGDVFYVFVGDATNKKRQSWEERENLLKERQQTEQQFQSRIEEYDQKMEMINREHLRRLEVIEGLSIDYESIFYVNLDEDQIQAYRVSNRFEKKFPKESPICRFTGFDSEYIKEWVYPEDQELLRSVTTPEYIREKLAGVKNFHINYRIFKNDKVVYIQLRVVNVSSEDHISQIVMGYRDVEEEIAQEMTQNQLLTDALNTANMANNAKNRFLSNMSHDIRTPMNAIINFVALIKRHRDDEKKVSNYLELINSASEQLLGLLNDVLEVSRIESAKIQLEKEDCNLIDVVHQVQGYVLPRAAAKNIRLSLDISRLKHINVYADERKLCQILTNIADNAIKYTNEHGWINIVISEQKESGNDGAVYEFTVEDNGIGIDEAFLEHIFEPFEREKNTTMSRIPGTGLGLTIAKDLVEMMGGTIGVSSAAGKGSKFTVTIPFNICERQIGYQEETKEETLDFASPKRILIVDDNEINLEIENAVLQDANFLVDNASDGNIAVEKVRQSAPGYYDLILMDIQMPVMDGYHATRAIREIEDPALANIPIIAVSANAFDEDRKNAMESGMNAHLAKPLDTEQLYKLIRKFLKGVEDAGTR